MTTATLQVSRTDLIELRFTEADYDLRGITELLSDLSSLSAVLFSGRLHNRFMASSASFLTPDVTSRQISMATNEVGSSIKVQRISLNSPLQITLEVLAVGVSVVSLLSAWVALRRQVIRSELNNAADRLQKDALKILHRHMLDQRPTADMTILEKDIHIRKLFREASKCLSKIERAEIIKKID